MATALSAAYKGGYLPLEDVLVGDSDPLSPRELTPEALSAIKGWKMPSWDIT